MINLAPSPFRSVPSRSNSDELTREDQTLRKQTICYNYKD